MSELIGLALIGGFISGIIGMFIGMTIDKSGSGFFLGAFLGPIGWIIVLLLPREAAEVQKEQNHAAEVETEVITENRSRDLTDDSYKIYLGKKYKIERNELFAQFECNEKLFDSLDDALAYADGLEAHTQSSSTTEKAETDGYILASEYAEKMDIPVEEILNSIRSGHLDGKSINSYMHVKYKEDKQ